ncbi:MAG: hypothetical protein ACOH2V_10540 [Candidatus Saccharimonadaceae bacterium]
MGMFLTKYSMLNALGYGDDSYILPETKKILSNYKLFGLIIHDPQTHPEFHHTLSEIFERLDYITGQDFLFFCLTDPPNKFRQRENRNYFGISEKEELLSPRNAYQTKDESITAYTLCQSLGLEYEDLPVIILTNNFQFDEFRYIKTNARYLEEQLKEIGFFCTQKQNFFDLKSDPELLELIRKIDTCGGNDIIANQEPIAKTLTDFLSFIVPDDRNQRALIHVKDLLEKNIKNRDNVMPPSKKKTTFYSQLYNEVMAKSSLHYFEEFEADLLNSNKIEKKNLFLLGSISNLSNTLSAGYNKDFLPCSYNCSIDQPAAFKIRFRQSNISKNDNYYIEINNDFIEDESKIVLRTFNAVCPNFQRLILEHDLQLDFSPLISSLCKIFEIEINLSFVHWVRAKLNIEMPAYYKRRKPGAGSYTIMPSRAIIFNPRPVDFNSGIHDKWKAPGMGESEMVCKTLHLENQFPDNLISNYNRFIKDWAILRNLRNMAAHTEAMNQNQFIEAKNAFSDFNNSGYFNQLANIKIQLKTPKNG